MLELLAYLRANGFKTFIVSGGGIEFMRPWTERVYGVPPEQVVGSSIKTRFEMRDGTPVLFRLPEVNFIDDKTGKPVGINEHIGRRPIAAFGNSDGDLEMLQWTTHGRQRRAPRPDRASHRRRTRICLRPQVAHRQARQGAGRRGRQQVDGGGYEEGLEACLRVRLTDTHAGRSALRLNELQVQEEISTMQLSSAAKIEQLTRQLSEALDHQTATSAVLRIISSAPGELTALFQAILANATKLCEASYGTLWLTEGDAFRVAAQDGTLPAAYMERLRPGTLFRLGPHLPSVQAINTRRPVHVPDLRLAQSYIDREPLAVAAVEQAGIYTMFTVPMFRDNEPIGVIAIYRQEMRPFADKHIELVQDFAAQAVLAIENTRLLSELRQRTDDLTRSLEDLRVAQDRLVQTEKLASLGQLTAGIAHEIKNPLNFVNNFSALSVELIDELRGALDGVQFGDDAARRD